MLGSVISVTVTDADGHEATDATHPVYDSLALLDADQTGAKEVALTFNDDIDADDTITVKKGSKEVKIDSTSYGTASATITLADKIVGGAEYTVTLTPDNGDDPTSVTFTGETATLGEIVFLNDVLVMADNKYSKGYTFVKGYDQYGDEINLSGLSVTPGVGKFESYDPKTGKITIDDGVADGQTSPFMTIKEVPVFVQYQNGTTVLSAQATLTVSTMAYLAEMEFGEIKKDGTPRDDGRLTVTELSSKKYYIEINDAKDQYGNALSADDLNKQKDDSKTLFVIPNDTGAFYTTGQFATLKGQDILWLADAGADSKPGSMALTITGAGGATFTTDIEVENDPFIQSLNVTYPMLYENVTKSDTLEFTAVDQYGDPVELWDVRPKLDPTDASHKTIVFTDKNHMTGRATTIALSGDVCFNDVDIDAAKKSFTATIDTTNAGGLAQADKGDIISFVATTAGMQVSTASVTVGGEGTAAKIKTDGKSVMLNGNGLGGDTSYNFNGKIAFEDANGNTMNRDDADFPVYANVADLATLNLASPNSKDIVGPFFWTLSQNKITNSTPAIQAGTLGEYKVAEMGDAVEDVYAILIGTDEDGALVVLDQQPYHFTQVVGTREVSYTATCADTLYVKKSDTYTDSVKVKVIAKTDKGETYEVKASRITLGGIPFATTNNEIFGNYDLDETGSKTASVYVGGTQAASVTVNYTNAAPTPTKTDYKFATTENGSRQASKYGTEVKGDAPDTIYAKEGTETLSIAGGVLTLAGVDGRDDLYEDGVTAQIVDQYGQTVTTTKFTIDGSPITTGTGIAVGKHIIEYAAGSVVGRFTLVVTTAIPGGNVDVVVKASTTVDSKVTLVAALTAAADDPTTDYTITLGDDIAMDEAFAVPANAKLVVPNGASLTSTAAVTVAGKLAIENGGEFATSGTTGKIVNNGLVSLGKTAAFTDGGTTKASGTGVFEVGNAAQFTALGVTAAATTYTVKVTEDLTAAAGTYTTPVEIAAKVTAGGALDFDKNVTIKDGGELVSSTFALNFDENLIVESGATVNISTAATLATSSQVTIAPKATITAAKFSLPTTAANTVKFSDGTTTATITADTTGTLTASYQTLENADGKKYVNGAVTASTVTLMRNGDNILGLTYTAGANS